MTSNESKSVYKTGEHAITKDDLVKSALNIGALGMEFSWTYVMYTETKTVDLQTESNY